MNVIEDLIDKRFPKEQQEQILGLVSYVKLMGLSGRDLVSLGTKMIRIAANEVKQRNLDLVSSFNCMPITTMCRGQAVSKDINNEFELEVNGEQYIFKIAPSYGWYVRHKASGELRLHYLANDAEFYPACRRARNRHRLLMDLVTGDLML